MRFLEKKIRIAVVGYGNIGKSAVKAILNAKDMELVGIIRRTVAPIDGLLVPVVSDVNDLLIKPDVCVLCAPSRSVPETAKTYLSKGIATVDSFDIHSQIADVREKLSKIAKEFNVACVTAAGWDPGSDSIVRGLMEAMAPIGITHTNFGPGMSMGHSVAVRAIDGVKDAISMTIPMGTSIHRRMVYIEIDDGADFDVVSKNIKADPYFSHDETHVILVDDVNDVKDAGHGVDLVRLGSSSGAYNQQFGFTMRIDNPALTAQILVGCARAALRQAPGCYTTIELPVVDLLPGDREYWVKKLV